MLYHTISLRKFKLDLSRYYTEISKNKLLSREEEDELMSRFYAETTPVKEKEAIREKVINSNMRCVFDLARKFSKNDPATFPDLIAAGNEGLIVGFDKYKPDKGTRVLSYSYWWVRQRMLEEMSNMRIVSLPVYRQQLSSKIQKFKDNNENITLDELKEEFKDSGVSHKDIEDLHKTRYLTFYISDLDESNFEINPIEEHVQRLMDDERCVEAVNKLPSPYREIIARSYGLVDGKEHSTSKLSRDLKISKEEIEEYKADGLILLRDTLNIEPN